MLEKKYPFDENCSYCAEGKLLDAFGIKIGELPMSKVILFNVITKKSPSSYKKCKGGDEFAVEM